MESVINKLCSVLALQAFRGVNANLLNLKLRLSPKAFKIILRA